jgi:hypothetical protein
MARIEGARLRFLSAHSAFERFQTARTIFDQRREWSTFLSELSATFNQVLRATKQHGKASAWAGRKKAERKDDPLLQYLAQARHSENHAIGQSAADTLRLSVKLNHGGPDVAVQAGALVMRGPFHTHSAKASQGISLIDVLNEGKWYPPPKSHLGQPLGDSEDWFRGTDPIVVGGLGLRWFEGLIAEAEEMLTK